MAFGKFQVCDISDTYIIIRTVLCSLIAITAIFGNIIILIGVYKMEKKGAKSYYILIANLAVTDILLGFCMLLYPLELIFPQLSEMRYFCLIRLSMIASLSACTGALLIAIATRRFICVVFPLKEHRYRPILDKILYIVIFCKWIAAFSIGFIPVMLRNGYDRGLDVKCENQDIAPVQLNFSSGIGVLYFVVYNTIVYIVMMYVLFRKSQFKNTNFKRTIVMALVFLVFAICWLPYVVLTLMSHWHPDVYCNIEYTTIPGYLNSAVNWIVYGATNSRFMQTFRSTKLFNGCSKCNNKCDRWRNSIGCLKCKGNCDGSNQDINGTQQTHGAKLRNGSTSTTYSEVSISDVTV